MTLLERRCGDFIIVIFEYILILSLIILPKTGLTQLTFTCSKLTKETEEKGVKHVQS